jgi:hypothetical protein
VSAPPHTDLRCDKLLFSVAVHTSGSDLFFDPMLIFPVSQTHHLESIPYGGMNFLKFHVIVFIRVVQVCIAVGNCTLKCQR